MSLCKLYVNKYATFQKNIRYVWILSLLLSKQGFNADTPCTSINVLAIDQISFQFMDFANLFGFG